MTATTLDISVIICAYTEDRWGDLVMAVESVQHQTVLPREVIIVIDHNLALLERVREHLPSVMVVENREARGLSGARNSGIAAAQGAVIAFLDDDAMAAPDWIEQLCSAYSDLNVVGVGGMIEPLWQDGRPAWFPAEFDWVVGCTYRGMPEVTSPVRNLIGANMSFKQEVFEVIGGFRDGVGQVGNSMLRCDDTEFCIRVSQHWPQTVFLYEPRAKVYHQVPTSRAQWNYFRSRCFTEGLAKALVSRFVGARDGLASERTYTLRTLPQGVARGLADTLHRRDPTGLGRAGAIVAGLAFTTAGYLTGIAAGQFANRKSAPAEFTYSSKTQI